MGRDLRLLSGRKHAALAPGSAAADRSAEAVARDAMAIAADICVYTNGNLTLETISRNEGKPEAALPKIVEGRFNGFFKDVALPLGTLAAVRANTWIDYLPSFIGYIGLATPNFLLALVMLYFANVWFGTSIGGLMDPEFVNQPMSWAKFLSILEHLWIPVIVIGTAGTAGTEAIVTVTHRVLSDGLTTAG